MNGPFSMVSGTVVGCGVAIATKNPSKKRVENYKSIITLEEINEEMSFIKASSNILE